MEVQFEPALPCEMLDSRYDDIKNGKVKLIPGEEVLARLRARIDERRNG